jgi:hypothetical protein
LTKPTLEPFAALQNTSKRAEGQPFLAFVVIGVALLVLIAAIVFILIAASTNTSKKVLDDQKQYTLDSDSLVKGIFSISAVKYVDAENASCTQETSYQRPVLLSLRFSSYEVPDSCSIFLNGKLLRSERRLDPDCNSSCAFAEFTRQFSLGDLDYRDSHTVRVCCNTICLEKQLPTLCTNAAVKP